MPLLRTDPRNGAVCEASGGASQCSRPFSKSFLKQIQLAGEATGTVIDAIMIHSAEELDAAFPAIEGQRTDAIIVQPSLPTKRCAELALSYRIPAVCAWRQFPRDGGLAAYFGAEDEMYRRAAVFVDKILKGSKAAELPVEQPTKFEVVVNVKTAKALGITVSPAILVRADELIEHWSWDCDVEFGSKPSGVAQ